MIAFVDSLIRHKPCLSQGLTPQQAAGNYQVKLEYEEVKSQIRISNVETNSNIKCPKRTQNPSNLKFVLSFVLNRNSERTPRGLLRGASILYFGHLYLFPEFNK
jgi:hypothetical protein